MRRNGLVRGMTAAFAMTSTLVAVQLAAAPAAQARCDGAGRELTSTLGASSVFVAERPVKGSCNRNNYYQATLRRGNNFPAAAVGVYIQNGGDWTLEGYTRELSDTYDYSDNNSYSYMTLCWYEADGTAHCGWGSTYGPPGSTPATDPDVYNAANLHGVNHGF